MGRREVRDIILDLKRQGRTIFFSTHILSDAEMLCDRVAVLVDGKLRGIGSPGEIVSMEVQGMEILFEVAKEQTLPPNIAARAKNIGNRYRIEVAEEELYAVLEQLRGCEGRILSVAPLRPSLEDYFFNLVGRAKNAGAGGGSGCAMSVLPGVVAINTFREAVRDRVLYNLIFFALMMIGAAILVGQISIGIERMVIINLGLSAISIFGIIMAIFIGVGLVYKEMEKRTLYSLLSKPIRRWEFLVGKFGGLLLTLVVNTSLMTLGLGAALYCVSGKFERSDATILVAVYFILLELALVTALALFFSCFTSPMLSTLYTLGIYVAGVFAPGILGISQFTPNWALAAITRFVYYVLPNFHNFGVIAAAAHGEARAVGADLAQHVVRGAVCGADSGGCVGGVFRAQSEMSRRTPK